MAINEVFATPTVIRVIFEIKFPNYFGIESKIGDIQLQIMSKFPKSKLLFKQQFAFVNSIQQPKSQDSESEAQTVNKIWQFKNEEEDITINITSGSLDISSNRHKTYNNPSVDEDARFRETISFVVNGFIKIIPLLKINRIGLRYIDKCPLPSELTLETFHQYYNTSFNFSNVKMDNISMVESLQSEILINRSNDIKVKRVEIFTPSIPEYMLDFDGMSFGINSSEYLKCLDEIHNEISYYFEHSLNEPVFTIMRKQ